MPKTSKKKHFDFEKNLRELENIIENLESGELTLEASLEYFERGIVLTRCCQKTLAEAEQKVQSLLTEDGKHSLAPFSAEDNQ